MRAWRAGGRRAEREIEGKRARERERAICTCRGRMEKREKGGTTVNVKV